MAKKQIQPKRGGDSLRTSLLLAFGKLAPLTLGISEFLAYALDPLPKMWDRIGNSGNSCMSNEINYEKEE